MLDKIKVIENFLTIEEYELIYNYIQTNKKNTKKFRVFELNNKKRYESMIPDRFLVEDHDEIFLNLKSIYKKIIQETKQFYNFDKDIYLHRVWLSVMGENTRLDWHNDIVDGWINFTAVIYLNDNYQGGEIVFEEIGKIIKPTKNMLLIFDSEMIHAVNEIKNGERVSISMWGTKDIDGSRIEL